MKHLKTFSMLILAHVGCAHVARAPRAPAAVDASRAWSERGPCPVWPHSYGIMDVMQDGIDVYEARDNTNGARFLTTAPEGCQAHRAINVDGSVDARYSVRTRYPMGKLTPREAEEAGCLVYGGPIVSPTAAPQLKKVTRYADRSAKNKFSFLAFPSPACVAEGFVVEVESAGWVNP